MRTLGWIISTMLLTILGYVVFFGLCCSIQYNGRSLVYLWSDYYASNGGPTNLKSLEWNDHCEKYKQWDAVILGASRAERSYDPQFFVNHGIEVFNFGTSAQSIQNSKILVDHILAGSSNTKEIWLDVYPASFKDDALESSADLIQNIGFVEAPFEIARANKDFRMVNLILKRYFCQNGDVPLANASYKENGYVAVDQTLSDELKNKLKNFHPYISSDFQVGEKSLRAFESILKICAEHHVTCRVIVSPVSDFGSQLELDRMLQVITPVLKSRNVTLVNLSKVPGIETALHFYDEKHLNVQGVKIFNESLLTQLGK
jgi:hypothetical protein